MRIIEMHHRGAKWQVHGAGDLLTHAAHRLASLLEGNPRARPIDVVDAFYADDIVDVTGAFGGIRRFTRGPLV